MTGLVFPTLYKTSHHLFMLEGLAIVPSGFKFPLPHQLLAVIFDVSSWSSGQVFGQVWLWL
jgi:hypothetical protein